MMKLALDAQIIAAQPDFRVIDLDCRDLDFRPLIPVVAWRLAGDGSVTPITLFGLPLRWAIVTPRGYFFDMSGRYFSNPRDLRDANRAAARGRLSTSQNAASEGGELSDPLSAVGT
jgi:hypothetical protein